MDILNVHPAAPEKKNRPYRQEEDKAREDAAKWAESKNCIIFFRTLDDSEVAREFPQLVDTSSQHSIPTWISDVLMTWSCCDGVDDGLQELHSEAECAQGTFQNVRLTVITVVFCFYISCKTKAQICIEICSIRASLTNTWNLLKTNSWKP
jgi:hypothetical protein